MKVLLNTKYIQNKADVDNLQKGIASYTHMEYDKCCIIRTGDITQKELDRLCNLDDRFSCYMGELYLLKRV